MLSRGTELDHYVLEGPLGAGGMGEVYVAMDTMLHRRVALKLLPRDTAKDHDARARMIREARAASGLRHPGIVTIYGFGEDDDRTYIAMELVEGENFAELIARRGAIPPREALELVAKVGDALDAAHRAGILHRDVKSANLMVEPNGHVKVLDFGLSKRMGGPAPPSAVVTPTPRPAARPLGEEPLDPEATTHANSNPSGDPDALTAAGTRMGTPAYSAPELWDGRAVDKRCDVFSLGVVFYELVMGRRPFAGDGESDLRTAIDEERFTPPSETGLDPRFDEVMERALRADPRERYGSVPELVAAARVALRDRRSRWLWAALALPVLAGGGVAAWHFAPVPLRLPQAAPALRRPPASTALTVVPRALTTGDGCASTPTFAFGDNVVYDRWSGADVDLYVVTFSGGEPRQLTSEPTWEWRAHMAYDRREVLYVQTDMQAKNGVGASKLVRVNIESGDTSWSKPIVGLGVAAAPDGVFYVRPTGRQIRKLTDEGESLIVDLPPNILAAQITASRDGERIAFVPEYNLPVALCLIDVGTKKLDCIPRPGIFAARPAFAPDGRAIYYASTRGIRRYTLDTKADEMVVPTVWALGGIAVSADGGALAYSDCNAVGPVVEVTSEKATVVLDERRLGLIAAGPERRLAYLRRFPDGDVVVYRDPAGEVRELTDMSFGTLGYLNFDPTGAWLVFATVLDGKEGLYVVGTDNGVPARRVTDDPSDNFPVWYGDRLVFTRNDKDKKPKVHYVSLATGEVTLASGADRTAYAADAATGELLVLSSGRERVEWWNPRTGKRRPGPPFELEGMGPSHSAFSPSGTWFLLGVGSGGRFYRMDLRKKQIEAEAVYDRPENKGVGVYAIDDDGKVYIQSWQWKGNLFGVSLPLGQ